MTINVFIQGTLRACATALCLAFTLVGSARTANAQQPCQLDVVPPELVGGPWINTTGNAPIKLASRKGKVTIIEFWTFG
jgi:hypothetical protein